MLDALKALQDDVSVAAERAGAKQFSDVSLSLDTARKRLADGQQQAVGPADLDQFARRAWTILCGPATGAATTTTLLDCLAALQEAVCTSAGSSSARAMTDTLRLLRDVLAPGLRRGATLAQLLRLKGRVWALLSTLDLLNRLKEAQTEGFQLLADLIASSSTSGNDSNNSSRTGTEEVEVEEADPLATTQSPDESPLPRRRPRAAGAVTLSAAQLNAEEMLLRCVAIAGKTAAGGQRVRAITLRLMGTLMATYASALASQHGVVRRGFEQAAHRLAQQQDVEQVVGEGLLDGLSAFLGVFPLHFHNPAEQPFIIFIHQLVKNALLLAERTTNYRFCDAALRFLTARAGDTLAECILDDSDSYLALLHTLWLHRNRNVHRAAYAATSSCLQALSQQLVATGPVPSPTASQSSEVVIEHVLTMVKSILATSGSTPTELCFVFVVCGYMARPLRACITTGALEALFSQVINKTDWLFPSAAQTDDVAGADTGDGTGSNTNSSSGSGAVALARPAHHRDGDNDNEDDVNEGDKGDVDEDYATGSAQAATWGAAPRGLTSSREDVVRLIPPLLVAFSCFLAEVKQVSSKAQRALASLIDTMLRMLPSDVYFERLRLATVPSVLQLLRVTDDNPSVGLDVGAFLSERAVWLACVADVDDGSRRTAQAFVPNGSSSSSGGGGGPVNVAPSLEAMPAWWQRTPVLQRQSTYVRFLSSLIAACDASEAAPSSAHDLARVGQRLRGELTRTILESARSLNLTVLFQGRAAPLNVVLAHSTGQDVMQPAALGPQSPADYGFFLNLVLLHSALARALWASLAAADSLSRWVVGLAQAHAASTHVSGFNTLLYTALQCASTDPGKGRIAEVGSRLSTQAQVTLAHWQRQCQQRLSLYTDDLLYQCAAAYLTILSVRTSNSDSSSWVSAEHGDESHLSASVQAMYATVQRALAVVLAAAPVATAASARAAADAQSSPFASRTTYDDVSARTTEATVRFVLRALGQLVAQRPAAAASLLPALLATPELAERRDVRSALEALTARYGDRIADAMSRQQGSHSSGSSSATTTTTSVARGVVPPPRWHARRTQLALPFPADASVEFPIAVVLARAAYLSCHATEQRVRSPAAELLHFVVVWLLGTGKKEAEQATESDAGVASWLPAVLPAMLQLASGETHDGVVQDVFRDLLLQTARWTSLMPCRWPTSASAAAMQRAFERCLTDHLSSQHAPLRRMATETLEEYLCWCSHQTSAAVSALSPTAAASCAGVLARVRLDLRAERPWARLGAVSLLHQLLRRMTRSGIEDDSHAPASLCALILPDWCLWLSALVAALRRSLSQSDVADVDGSRSDDGSGLVGEAMAAFSALSVLLADSGPAGTAARAALRQRQGAAPAPPPQQREEAQPQTSGTDPLAALIADALELCWLSAAHTQQADAQATLWCVLDQLCRCEDGEPNAQQQQQQGVEVGGAEAGGRAVARWLSQARGRGALCALLSRGRVAEVRPILASLNLCCFITTRLQGSDAHNNDGEEEDVTDEAREPRAGVKRSRPSTDHSSTSSSSGSPSAAVMTEVVCCATQRMGAQADEAPVSEMAALLAAVTQLVEACVLQDGRRAALVDPAAVTAQVLVRPVFALTRRVLFDSASRTVASSAIGGRALGVLYALAQQQQQPPAKQSVRRDGCVDVGSAPLPSLLAELSATLPSAVVGPASSEDVMHCLSQPLSARHLLESLAPVAALASLRCPGFGVVNMLPELVRALPRQQAQGLSETWFGVLAQLIGSNHNNTSVALPRPDRQALLADLFVLCLSLNTREVASEGLVDSFTALLSRLSASVPAAGEDRPIMTAAAQACGVALRRLLPTQSSSPSATLDGLARALCDATRSRLFPAGPTGTVESVWQTDRELSALLLLQSLRAVREHGDPTHTPRLVKAVLAPLFTADTGDEEQGRAATVDVYRDAARLEFILEVLSGLGGRAAAIACQQDAATAHVVAALASAAGDSARWTGSAHALLASATAVRLLELSARVFCGCGLAAPASSATAPPPQACTLDGARGVLLAVLSDELPLDWKELAPDSTEASAFPRVVRTLVVLAASLAPHKPDAVTHLLPLLAQTDLPEADLIGETVRDAVRRLSTRGRLELCEHCVALQCGGLPPSMWWAATYRLMLPVLASFGAEERVAFFTAHVAEWVGEAGRVPLLPLSRQTNALVLLEAMYRLTDAAALRGAINDAYVAARATSSSGGGHQTTTGKELVLALIKVCNTARGADSPSLADASSDGLDEWLAYRQAALRCLVAVVTATQQQEAVFVKLLLDGANVDAWSKAVDARRCTALPVECDFPHVSEQAAQGSSDWELRSRRVAGRADVAHQVGSLVDNMLIDGALEEAAGVGVGGGGVGTGAGGESVWFVSSSQALTGRLSTMTALGAGQRGLSAAALGTAPATTSTAATPSAGPMRDVVLDGVWRSTCLGALFAALDYMITQFHTVPSTGWAPAWVMELWKLLRHPGQPLAVKLVAVRLVQLRPEFFAKYADHFVEPLTDAVASPQLGTQLHYVAREVMCIIVDWVRRPGGDEDDGDNDDGDAGEGGKGTAENKAAPHTPAVALSTAAATSVLRYLFSSLLAGMGEDSSEQYVLRNNMELFRGVCAAMGPSLLCDGLRDVPVVDLITNAPSKEGVETFVQLLGVLGASGVCFTAVWSRAQVQALHDRLLRLLAPTHNVKLTVAAAEVIAVELQALAQYESPSQKAQAAGRLEPDVARDVMGTLETQLRGVVESLWSRAALTVLHVLRVVEAYHARLVTADLARLVFGGFPMRTEEEQLLVLDILGCVPDVTASIYSTVSAQFAGALGSFCGPVRTAVYALLVLLTPSLPLVAVCELTRTFLSASALDAVRHEAEERTGFFQLAVAAHVRLQALCAATSGNPPSNEQESERAQGRTAAEQTLHLLTTAGLEEGSSPFVQDIILAHLDESCYPDSPAARLAALLEGLGQREEVGRDTRWLRHTAVLLLSPCRRTKAYGDASYLFDAPLAECTFVPKSFTAHATQTRQQPPPLFSESAGSLAGAVAAARASVVFTSVGASQRPSSTLHGTRPAATNTKTNTVASMRARTRDDPRLALYTGTHRRQPTQFPSSVQPRGITAGYLTTHQSASQRQVRSGSSRRVASQVSSQLLPARATVVGTAAADRGAEQRAWREPIARRLRPLPTGSRDVMYMVAATRDRQERELRDREEQLQLLRHRVLFRLYREGELPDVQVPVSSLIAPLQALCLYDTVTAQLTCVALVQAVLPSEDTPVTASDQMATTSNGPQGRVPFFAPAMAHGHAPLVQQQQQEQQQQQQAAAMGALCQFLAKTTATLTAATPVLSLRAVQELLLCSARQWWHQGTAGIAAASAVAQQLMQLAVARHGDHHTGADEDETIGAAVLFEEPLAASTANTTAAQQAWTGLSHMLGMLGETDLVGAALARAVDVAQTSGSVRADLSTCLRTMQRALNAEDGAAYEQALTLWATCRDQLPPATAAEASSDVSSALHALLLRRQTRAARAMLRWDTVHELSADVVATRRGTVEAAAVAVEACRHVAPTQLPGAFDVLCELDGGRERASAHFPFEAAAESLLGGQWAACEAQAQRGLSRVLESLSGAHAVLDGAAARACREAYRLRQAQQVGHALTVLDEGRAEAARVVRELAQVGFAPLVRPTPALADSALWLLHAATSALAKPVQAQFGAEAWHALEERFAASRVALCRESCESLLRSPLTNGAVKALLDAVAAVGGDAASGASHDAPSPLLYATALRANLYRLAHTGPQRTDITTTALIDGLQRRVESQAQQLPAEERRALHVDVQWCAMMLILPPTHHRNSHHHHHAARTTTTSSSELAQLVVHATSMQRQLTESVDEHLRLLAVMDRVLGGLTRSGGNAQQLDDDDDGDENDDARASRSSDSVTEDEDDVLLKDSAGARAAQATASANKKAQKLACWHLYLDTFIWCVEAIGAGRVTDTTVQANIAMQVPRVLQFFDVVRGGKRSESEVATAADAASRLVELPATIWLPWPSQLISTLLRTHQVVPAQLLVRLAQAAPQTVYYPYHCAKEELVALEAALAPNEKTVLQQLRLVLEGERRLWRARLLADELLALHEPVMRLRDELRVLAQVYRRFVDTAAEAAFHEANALYQRCWQTFADAAAMDPEETVRLRFRETAVRVLSGFAASAVPSRAPASAVTLSRNWELFKQAYRGASDSLTQFAQHTPAVATARIADYSVKLDGLLCHAADRASGDDTADALEMPMQPVLALEQSHAAVSASGGGAGFAVTSTDKALLGVASIVGAHPMVRVLSSVQRPKRLELYSSTMSTHVYLAKGGDDLRLDQRVEELFCVLNQHLHAQGATPRLLVHTYSVIPLSAQVGLVQWVAHTDTLHSVMDREHGQRLAREPALEAYSKRYGGGTTAYLQSFWQDAPAAAGQWYDGLVASTPHGLLQRGLQQISPSLCRWYGVRDGFCKSNAALSITSHVFGIGDRHLSNFLIDTTTGHLIGIDYGHAFGSATETLPIPELVPFRLTPQIKEACGLLGEEALASAMVTVLHTLRRHRSVLESLAQAFVHEPLTQWKQLRPEQRAAYARRKLDGVAGKLDLENAWSSLLASLRYNRHVLDYEKQNAAAAGGAGHWFLARIRAAVLSQPSARTPSAVNEESEVVEATHDERVAEATYVRQLMDLAQNTAVLSRAYVGWNPLF